LQERLRLYADPTLTARSGKNKKIRQVAILCSHAEQVKTTIFHAVSLKVDADVRKQRLSLNKVLKGHADTLLQNIQKLEYHLTTRVCSQGELSVCSPSTAEIERLREDVARDVEGWTQHWATLKALLPEQLPEGDHSDIVSGMHKEDSERATLAECMGSPGHLTNEIIEPKLAPLRRAATSGSECPRKRPKGTHPAWHSVSESHSRLSVFNSRGEHGEGNMHNDIDTLEPQTKTSRETELAMIKPVYCDTRHAADYERERSLQMPWQQEDDWGYRGVTANTALDLHDSFTSRNGST